MRRAGLLGLLLAAAASAAADGPDPKANRAAAVLAAAERIIPTHGLTPSEPQRLRAAVIETLHGQAATDRQRTCLERAAGRSKGPDYAAALGCIGFDARTNEQRDTLLRALVGSAFAAAGDPDGGLIHIDDFAHIDDAGQAGAVGLLFRIVEDGVRIEGVRNPDTAKAAQVPPGSFLLAIDGQKVAGLSGTRLAARLRGPVGSEATLTIADPAGTQRDVTFTRIEWQLDGPSVEAAKQGTTLALRPRDAITDDKALFSQTPEQIRAQLTAHTDAGEVILDLRGNTGGELDAAIAVAQLFVANGEIASMEERIGGPTLVGERWKAAPGDQGETRKVTVVVDAGTAAGAELIAAALADNTRARIVGTPTFGRGTVQTLLPLAREGYYAKLTTGRLRRPSGAPLASKVMPDCTADALPADLGELIAALQALDCAAPAKAD